MARSQRHDRPVSDEEFTEMDEKIGEHFDEIRELLEDELDDSDA